MVRLSTDKLAKLKRAFTAHKARVPSLEESVKRVRRKPQRRPGSGP